MTSVIKFTLKELRKLTFDKNSCVEEKQVTQNIALKPWCLGNIEGAVQSLLDYKIGKFDKDLQGILLSYKNLKIIQNFGAIRNDNVDIHFQVHAEYFVFRPYVGATLRGIINKKSVTHLGIIVHRVFNVVVPRPTEEPDDRWIGSKVKEGQTVVVKIVVLDLYGALPYIRGELDERSIYGTMDGEKDNGTNSLEEKIVVSHVHFDKVKSKQANDKIDTQKKDVTIKKKPLLSTIEVGSLKKKKRASNTKEEIGHYNGCGDSSKTVGTTKSEDPVKTDKRVRMKKLSESNSVANKDLCIRKTDHILEDSNLNDQMVHKVTSSRSMHNNSNKYSGNIDVNRANTKCLAKDEHLTKPKKKSRKEHKSNSYCIDKTDSSSDEKLPDKVNSTKLSKSNSVNRSICDAPSKKSRKSQNFVTENNSQVKLNPDQEHHMETDDEDLTYNIEKNAKKVNRFSLPTQSSLLKSKSHKKHDEPSNDFIEQMTGQNTRSTESIVLYDSVKHKTKNSPSTSFQKRKLKEYMDSDVEVLKKANPTKGGRSSKRVSNN